MLKSKYTEAVNNINNINYSKIRYSQGSPYVVTLDVGYGRMDDSYGYYFMYRSPSGFITNGFCYLNGNNLGSNLKYECCAQHSNS
jgi:hypothetical protein